QIDGLFVTLKGLRDQGHSIVIVTHKLKEVTEIADRVTVLKQGRVSTVAERGNFNERTLALAMTGREIEDLPPRQAEPQEGAFLSLRGLTVHGGDRLHAVHDISFAVQPAEILGVAGVEGNGQRELVDALAGVVKVDSGTILLDGVDITGLSPRK